MIFQIPPRMSYGHDVLAFWDNIFTEEEINLILSRPEWLQTEPAYIGVQSTEKCVNSQIRETSVSWLTYSTQMHGVWSKLSDVFSEVNRRYFHYDLNGFYEPIQLGIYSGNNKGHYDWHIDANHTSNDFEKFPPRKLSMALLLSEQDQFEGGEFQVKVGDDTAHTLETKRGRAWFFPSYLLHRVTPVTKGIRRSLVLWAGGPPFR